MDNNISITATLPKTLMYTGSFALLLALMSLISGNCLHKCVTHIFESFQIQTGYPNQNRRFSPILLL